MKSKQTDNYRNCYNYKLDLNLDKDDKKCITPMIIYQTMVEVIHYTVGDSLHLADVLQKFINKYHNTLMRNEKEFGVIDKLENDNKLLQNKNNDLTDELKNAIFISQNRIKNLINLTTDFNDEILN
jgi:hypothetical protein